MTFVGKCKECKWYRPIDENRGVCTGNYENWIVWGYWDGCEKWETKDE